MAGMARKVVVWLSYLDPSLPRRLGRRIPRSALSRRASLEEALEACKALGLSCSPREGKYPRTWYAAHQAVEIEYSGGKGELLKLLSKEISKIQARGSSGTG